MRLTPKRVGEVLEAALGQEVEMNPYGFELCSIYSMRARLQRGSGIAGRGNTWTLVRLPDGASIAIGITTRTQLVRTILEFMAGPPPAPLADYTVARAKRVVHPTTLQVRYVWYRRLKKRPRARVALVPFGSAQR